MKRVYRTNDPATMGIVRDLLLRKGIETKVLNQHATPAFPGVPLLDATPELWVVRDEDEATAEEVIARFESGEIRDELSREPWTCPQCGEVNEGQFTQCWRCAVGDPRDDPEARCERCGYLLWSLPQRRCPECGTQF